MLALALCVVSLPLLLLLFEVLAEKRDRQRYPPPGRFIPTINLHFIEKGHAAPTVILESGLTASSISWVQTQSQIANFAKVVAYDRAGLGWSPPRNSKITLDDLTADLATLVNSQSQPVILVGHSFGALLVGAFAHLRPDRVGGLVLVDPVSLATFANPDQFQLTRLRRGIRLSNRGALLARFAIVRISLALVARGSQKLPSLIGRVSAGKGSSIMHRLVAEVAKLPPATYGPIRSHWSRSASFRLMADYLRLLPKAARQAEAMPIPLHIPVIILSAASAKPCEFAERETWVHNRLFSRHTQVPDTTHWLHLDRPNLVAEAVLELASAIK